MAPFGLCLWCAADLFICTKKKGEAGRGSEMGEGIQWTFELWLHGNMSAHYGKPSILDFSINGTEDCAKVKKSLIIMVLCLSASLNVSGDGIPSDILTCPTDNIHLSIFPPLNKGFFGKVMLIIHPRQRTYSATMMNGFVGAGGLALLKITLCTVCRGECVIHSNSLI